MLNEIRAKLEEIDPNVYYGAAVKLGDTEVWDYTVFMRVNAARSANNAGVAWHFAVGIVREDFIPEELPGQVIRKLEEIPGVRLASSNIDFAYTRKPGTDQVIEVATIQFTRPTKKCG